MNQPAPRPCYDCRETTVQRRLLRAWASGAFPYPMLHSPQALGEQAVAMCGSCQKTRDAFAQLLLWIVVFGVASAVAVVRLHAAIGSLVAPLAVLLLLLIPLFRSLEKYRVLRRERTRRKRRASKRIRG